jgi:hypothetical protein
LAYGSMWRKSGFFLDRREDTRLLFLGEDWRCVDDDMESVDVAALGRDGIDETVLARLLASIELDDVDLRCDGRSIMDGLPMKTTDTTRASAS